MSPFFHLSKEVAEKIKKKAPEMWNVIGGQHITIMEAAAFDPVFDFGLVGDCEEQWPNFLRMPWKELVEHSRCSRVALSRQ